MRRGRGTGRCARGWHGTPFWTPRLAAERLQALPLASFRVDDDADILDYEGVQFKRSQRVVRYHDGSDGYDWPEVVPASVRAKVARLLDGGE